LELDEGSGPLRWEALFDDLEMQWEAMEAADVAAEVADRSRREVARLRLVDRLRPAIGQTLRFGVIGAPGDGASVDGRLVALGADWVLLAERAGREALVPMRSVLWVDGLSAASAQPGHEGTLAARLDLRYALRGLARDRAAVDVSLVDGTVAQGIAHRVGADFFELVSGVGGGGARRVRTIVLDGVALVRRSV
jgi:hypothetical protein